MSKKDYQALVAALYRSAPGFLTPAERRAFGDAEKPEMRTWRTVVENVSNVLAEGNPRFDRERFLEACETGRCKGMRQVA